VSAQDWLEWLPTVISILIAVGVFVSRIWLKSKIERSVQHTFDAKLEVLRADLRGLDERFKSELRTKEAEISALRDGALSGRALRQAPVDRRRLEAIERIWTRVSTSMGAYKVLAFFMGAINPATATSMTLKDPKTRKFFESFVNKIPENDTQTNNVSIEQLFVSPLAWAYFSSYQTILYIAYARARLLVAGVDDLGKILDPKPVREILRSALPHHSAYIDSQPLPALHILLDELEGVILTQLRLGPVDKPLLAPARSERLGHRTPHVGTG
jgi:hypothetical protein